MTIPNQIRITNSLGNDTTPTYPYTFRIKDDDDIAVYLLPIATGIQVKLLNTDYTVNGPYNQDQGGTYTITNPAYLNVGGNLETGDILVVIGERVDDQTISFKNQEIYLPAKHEAAFDDRTVISQQNDEKFLRSLHVAVTNNTMSTELPALNSFDLLWVNADGDAIVGVQMQEAIGQITADDIAEGLVNLFLTVAERALIAANALQITQNIIDIGDNTAAIGVNVSAISANAAAIIVNANAAAAAQATANQALIDANAGANKQVQFNDNGTAAGADEMLWNDVSKELTLSHLVIDKSLNIGGDGSQVISGTVNDLVLTNAVDQNVFLISAVSAAIVTGIVSQGTGRIITIVNFGTTNITFRDSNAGSLEANRLLTPENLDIVVKAACAITFFYSGSTVPGLWRCCGLSQQAVTGGTGVTSVNGDTGPNVLLDTGDIPEATDLSYVPDAAAIALALTTLGHILVANGADYNSVLLSGDATITAAGVMSVIGGAADHVIVPARINEVAGVSKGNIVYLTGATGGVLQVALADNTDFAKVNVLAMCNESGADNAFIDVVLLGEVEGIDTSAFTEGDVLYLTTAGQFTNVHPTGTDAVVRIGYVVRDNVSTGSVLFVVESLTIAANFNGVMRHQIVNMSNGVSAISSYTMVNDLNHRVSLSLAGSNFVGEPEAASVYNQGYGPLSFFNDGNVPFNWYSDPLDNHDASNLGIIMSLSAVGKLSLPNDIDVGGQVINSGPGWYTQLTTKIISSTTAETTRFTTGVGSGVGDIALPADFWTPGKVVKIIAYGTIANNNTTPTITWRLKLGSTTMRSSAADIMTAALGGKMYRMEATMRCTTAGVSGTIMSSLYFTYCTGEGITSQLVQDVGPSQVTFDTTAAGTIDLTFQWSVGNIGNNLTTSMLSVETITPG